MTEDNRKKRDNNKDINTPPIITANTKAPIDEVYERAEPTAEDPPEQGE